MKLWVATLLVLLGAQSSFAYVETPPFRWRAGTFRLSSLVEYSYTNQNYFNSRNSYQNLQYSNSYQEEYFRLRGRYNFATRLSGYLSSTLVNANPNDTILGNRNTTSITEADFGIDWSLLQGAWNIVAEVDGSLATDPVSSSRTNPLGSDGVNYVRGTLYLLQLNRFVNFIGSIGAKGRDQGMSALFNYSAALEKPLMKRFLLGVGVDGYESLNNDTQTQAYTANIDARTNAGSYLHYSNTDSVMLASGWVGFAPINTLQMRLGFQETVGGVRTALSSSGFLNVTWGLDPSADQGGFASKSAYSQQRRKDDQGIQKATQGFEAPEEDSNDELFYEDLPTSPRARPVRRAQPPVQNQQQYAPPPDFSQPNADPGSSSPNNPLDDTEKRLEP